MSPRWKYPEVAHVLTHHTACQRARVYAKRSNIDPGGGLLQFMYPVGQDVKL